MKRNLKKERENIVGMLKKKLIRWIAVNCCLFSKVNQKYYKTIFTPTIGPIISNGVTT